MNKYTPDAAGWLLDEYDREDFWSKVNFLGGTAYEADPLVDTSLVKGECWAWQGAFDNATSSPDYKYGHVSLWGRKYRAHRISYRDFGNKLDDQHVIDHLCRNTVCVNPSHLEAVKHAENVRRGKQNLINRSHCRNGHEITVDNIIVRKRGDGSVRACKTCFTASKKKTYLKRKARLAA